MRFRANFLTLNKGFLGAVIALLLLIPLGSFAQTKAIKDLKAKQKKTMEQLALTSKMLDENKKNTSATLNRLTLLNNQIDTRRTLIGQINEEIRLTSEEIDKLCTAIASGQQEVEQLKKQYAELIYQAYWSRSEWEKLMFVLAADNLSQSYRRFRYLQEMSAYRKEQAQKIVEKTTELSERKEALEAARTEKEKSLHMKEVESQRLVVEQNRQTAMVKTLKQQENTLLKKLQADQKQINQLNDKITALIAEEERKAAEAARKKAEEEAKRKVASSGKPAQTTQPTYSLTKEEQLVAGNFEKNKGRLPWPVEKGFISGKFGLQPHPVLTHVTTNNKGIYIRTAQGADARAVFEGEVTQRFSVPGGNNAVIVKHGNYRTVYTNLTTIYVKVGDHVSAKQKIGRIYSDPEEGGKTELYFMVYKDKDLQNPELFLAK